ncbi:MAG: hypothetical protein H0U74_00400 [Bradymonadaceae bacterium]|nr:hypothetical protein [Lujinxingiaceae bacterium]
MSSSTKLKNLIICFFVALGVTAMGGCDLFFNVDEVRLSAPIVFDVNNGPGDVSDTSDAPPVLDVNDDADTAVLLDVSDASGLDADSSMPDADSSMPDADASMPDADASGPDAEVSEPPPLCPVDHGTYVTTVCHIVNQTGCSSDRFCGLAGGPPPSITCALRTNSAGVRQLYESCGGNDKCIPGLGCINWQWPDPRGSMCSKYCLLSTGEGCSADAYCNRQAALLNTPDLGVCVPRCDPYAAGSCQAGEACTADYDHPALTCHPQFRCLRNGTASSTDYDSLCLARSLHGNGLGCTPGRTCYPVFPEDRVIPGCVTEDAQGKPIQCQSCVTACTNDAKCIAIEASMRCQAPRGANGLRYCE